MKKGWLSEPLLHFVLLGAGLFVLDAWLGERTAAARDDEIVVTGGRIENLVAVFTKTWQRPPTAEELARLVDEHVLEEAIYREGLALGLDREDIVVRRRVRQKMEFVLDDVLAQIDPGEEELARWYDEHGDDYVEPGRIDFRQVYLNPERQGDGLRARAEALLDRLRSDAVADPAVAGDRTLLDHAHADAHPGVVANTFGPAFADALERLPAGEWAGPLESPFGLHLVIIDARREERRPPLVEVRAAVARDWLHAQRQEAVDRYHGELLGRYRVTIEWPDGQGPSP